jgi:hypothetical protein
MSLFATMPWSRKTRFAGVLAVVAGVIALLFVVGFLIALVVQGD